MKRRGWEEEIQINCRTWDYVLLDDDLPCLRLSCRILKEEISPVLGEWRFSRGFDKGSLQVATDIAFISKN